MPRSQAARYWIPTETFERRPSSVTSPGVDRTSSSSPAPTVTSSRCRSIWFGRSPRTRSNDSNATGTRSGCATHVPSKPCDASRSLSSRTFSSAIALTSGSRREGMNAAMPPIAWAPRLWHVFTSSSQYARMNGTAIVTVARSGRTNSGRWPSFLMTLKM